MKLWSVETIFNFWLPNGEVLLSMFCGKEWNIFTDWEGQLLCLLQVYSSSSFLFHSFKLRNVVIENENTLNIQFFYLKWKKKFAPMTGWREFNLLFSLLLGQRRHTPVTEIKIMWERQEAKKETLNIWKYIKENKTCLTLVWTMLLIVTQLGCLTYIFRIHCYMEMTLNFSKVKLKKSYKSWPYFFFVCFWLHSVAWGILASRPEAMLPAVEALSLNHWMATEVSKVDHILK